MSYIKKIFLLFFIVVLMLSGCQSGRYTQSIDIGAEYPVEMFPVYKDAVIYEYSFENGVIDITFGTSDDYEKVGKYYELLFEHSKYDVTADKMTTESYISSGKTNHYKYLLEVNKAELAKQKKYFNSTVSLRITINGFVTESTSYEATPTPQAVDKVTPAPTNTAAPTDTPQPTEVPDTYLTMEVISSADMTDEFISIECLDVSEKTKNEQQKTVSVLLKVINYGQSETGYIMQEDFTLIDAEGTEHYSDMADGLFASGVNILPGGYCVEYVRFVVDNDVVSSVLAIPDGLGSRLIGSYDLDLAPQNPPADAGAHNSDIIDEADISDIPAFIIGQEYTFDGMLTIKLNDAQYFENHTTVNPDNLMYTFSVEFDNISDNVIIPAEIKDFVLYDIKHNIMVKPTEDLTPYDELAFNPVQSGLSENYNISFEIFEETSENYLCLLVSDTNQQNNPVIYKIR